MIEDIGCMAGSPRFGSISSMSEKIREAKVNNTILHVPGAMPDTPSWNIFLSILDNKFNNPVDNPDLIRPQFVQNTLHGKPTLIFKPTDLSLHIWNITNLRSREACWGAVKESAIYPYVNKLIDISNSLFSPPPVFKAAINFVGNETLDHKTLGHGAHKDYNDVISWQCINSTEYRIYESRDGDQFNGSLDTADRSYTVHTINPGDLFFIPRGTIHEVFPFTYRATIIMDFNIGSLDK